MSGKPEPTTFGGPGWVSRTASHAADVDAGAVWHRCGAVDEIGPLREVLLSWPSADFGEPGDADAALMLSWPDLDTLRQETDGLRQFFESRGVVCHVHKPPTAPPLNYLFMRDLVLMTPEGAIIARPASAVRADEPRFAARALADIGVPIVGTPRGTATFEGADALWLDRETLVIGIGLRTNRAGFEAVQGWIAPMGVTVLAVDVPPGAQHLLGVVVPVDAHRAIVDEARTSPALSALLAEHGIEPIFVPPDADNRERRGMNVVVLGPGELVMPAGCPGLRSRFEQHGLIVHALPVDAHVQAAGALGCMTAIIRRDEAAAR
jgi:N-dimethylarginine dimethylaminohydrolase